MSPFSRDPKPEISNHRSMICRAVTLTMSFLSIFKEVFVDVWPKVLSTLAAWEIAASSEKVGLPLVLSWSGFAMSCLYVVFSAAYCLWRIRVRNAALKDHSLATGTERQI